MNEAVPQRRKILQKVGIMNTESVKGQPKKNFSLYPQTFVVDKLVDFNPLAHKNCPRPA
jgi:hypothetical protein